MTPDPILDALRGVRARLRFSRTVETAVRWTLYASLLACVCLAASKFFAIAPASAVALAVIPLGAAAFVAARRITLRECAVMIDGSFRLDERVSTAAEVAGGTAMELAVREDARRALSTVDAGSVARVRWPRETRFLAVAAVIIAALAFAPSPRAATTTSVELEAVAHEEAAKLKDAARNTTHAKEVDRILDLLRSGDPEKLRQAVIALQALEAAIGEQLAGGKLSPEVGAALRELADRAAGAGAGIGRELAAVGIDVQTRAPLDVDLRLRRAAEAAARSERPEAFDAARLSRGVPVSPVVQSSAAEALRARGWASKYDDIVTRYYEEKK